MEAYKKERDDLTIPSKLTAGYILSNFGTDLDAIEPFTSELTEIVDKMKEELANEKRILEGTDVPEYGQNELSPTEVKEDQWRNFSPFGFSRTGPIRISTPDLNNSSCSARPNSPVLDIVDFADCSCPSSSPSWRAISDGYGRVIDAMNESSECTVPMISEPTPGTPSEEK
jgi:hypothetical protein